ncbi:MAG TPA: TIGR00730 family Rossman fold protein, partial [Burkholderiales bacterium]|nr:TIGR00730 family Rossman fold protein [Burkholderiales bacterium]
MAEFFEATERLAGIRPAVSMFGSARVKEGSAYYKLAEETARLLSDAGFATISGGGPGVMEATNKGAFHGKGLAVGLNIDLPFEQASNKYQHISLRFKHFFARKVTFARYATAFVVLPGGYGTLDELFEALTLVQTGKTRQMPIILVHEPYWRGLLEWCRERMAAEGMIDATDLDLLQICNEPRQVVDAIFTFYEKRGFEPSPAEREVMLNL